jgi:hypothetical protein
MKQLLCAPVLVVCGILLSGPVSADVFCPPHVGGTVTDTVIVVGICALLPGGTINGDVIVPSETGPQKGLFVFGTIEGNIEATGIAGVVLLDDAIVMGNIIHEGRSPGLVNFAGHGAGTTVFGNVEMNGPTAELLATGLSTTNYVDGNIECKGPQLNNKPRSPSFTLPRSMTDWDGFNDDAQPDGTLNGNFECRP